MVTSPSHVVISCTCGKPWPCPVPGHDLTPPDRVEPRVLVDAGRQAFVHLLVAQEAVLKARAAWVSRGLPADNRFPASLDQLAANLTHSLRKLRSWTDAAELVASRREQV